MKKLIKGATILTMGSNEPFIGDILIDGDCISDIQNAITTEVDASNIRRRHGWRQCLGESECLHNIPL